MNSLNYMGLHRLSTTRAKTSTSTWAALARSRARAQASSVAPDRMADIQGRRVVLVDDVLTSGATTDACARALLRAKAAEVDVLVFARVVESHKAPI